MDILQSAPHSQLKHPLRLHDGLSKRENFLAEAEHRKNSELLPQ